ncbi:hypothetical protein [Chryseobacterium sp. M5A1_1a]
MKKILLIILSLFIFSCGSRKKSLIKSEESTELQIDSKVDSKTSLKSNESSIIDFRNYLLNNGLKIKSTGQNYELRYGDLLFTGSADLEFTEKKEESIVHYRYYNHTTYITETKYQTKTDYQTQKIFRTINIERKGVSFGSIVWIVITSLIVGAITSQLIRLYLKRKK